jgi:hypothetical protein
MSMKKILFIHHSTGGLLLRFGHVRELLRKKAPELELWDHGYNCGMFGPITFRTGLSDSEGRMTGRDFNIVISNNSPKEYAEIFSRNREDSTLKQILSFDVVIFKNCFPTSNITSDKQLLEYKFLYGQIFSCIAAFPNKFIVFTHPPLRREVTSQEIAMRARNLASWLKEQEGKNISVFNFFDLLADSTGANANMLRREYCSILPIDSHPNIRANREVGQLFVEKLLGYSKQSGINPDIR